MLFENISESAKFSIKEEPELDFVETKAVIEDADTIQEDLNILNENEYENEYSEYGNDNNEYSEYSNENDFNKYDDVKENFDHQGRESNRGVMTVRPVS